MESSILNYVPEQLITWFTFAGFVVLGVVAIYGQWFKAKDPITKEANARSSKLITVLQESVAALEKKINYQETLLNQTKMQLDQLIIENKTFREILEGRDGSTKEYQDAGRRAFKDAQEVREIVSRIDTNITSMLKQEIVETTTKQIKRI